jgi:protein-tyrosine phosphatase
MDWFTLRPDDEARLSRGEGRPRVSEICGQLLIGEYPRVADIGWLREHHRVTAVHSVQDDDDLKFNGLKLAALEQAYRDHSIKFIRTAIPDSGADALGNHLAEALAELKRLTDAGDRVFLHCNAGMNRAPTIAIAYLRAFCGRSLEEALAQVKQRHFCGPYMTVLEEYFGPRDFKPPGHEK